VREGSRWAETRVNHGGHGFFGEKHTGNSNTCGRKPYTTKTVCAINALGKIEDLLGRSQRRSGAECPGSKLFVAISQF
jgi:hypothetical protein